MVAVPPVPSRPSTTIAVGEDLSERAPALRCPRFLPRPRVPSSGRCQFLRPLWRVGIVTPPRRGVPGSSPVRVNILLRQFRLIHARKKVSAGSVAGHSLQSISRRPTPSRLVFLCLRRRSRAGGRDHRPRRTGSSKPSRASTQPSRDRTAPSGPRQPPPNSTNMPFAPHWTGGAPPETVQVRLRAVGLAANAHVERIARRCRAPGTARAASASARPRSPRRCARNCPAQQ